MFEYLEKNGNKLPYKIIKTKNKNTYIKVKIDHIEVKVGKYNKLEDAFKLFEEKFDYFYLAFNSSKYEELSNNEIILEHHKYNLIINYEKGFKYEISNNDIIVYTNLKDISKIKKNIYTIHLEKMINKIDSDILTILKNNNISRRKIVLKYFKTRYGSYHKNDDLIKLNIILAKGTLKELYYVIMHEYAHTKHFNHSKNFYNLLEKLMPDYRKYDKLVKNISIYI